MRGTEADWQQLSEIDQKLCNALKCKQFDLVDKLISEGANINARFGNRIYDTPLHFFVYDFDIMQKLISCGASIHARNKYEETALRYSCIHESPASVTRLLLKSGVGNRVDRLKSGNHTALYKAIRKSKLEHIIALLSYKASLNISVVKRTGTLTSFQLAIRKMPQFIMKYMALHGYWLQDYMKEFPSDKRDEYVEFWENCTVEVKSMDSEKISETSTILEICRSLDLDENFEPTKQSLNSYKTGDYQSRFPIYGDVIEERCNFYVQRRSELLNSLDDLHVLDVDDSTELNADCKRLVAEYMTNKELSDFVSAAGWIKSNDGIEENANENSGEPAIPNKIRKLDMQDG